ncbi:MAG: hemolysin family protein [Alphaproteobacteria bacterium]|nr:hemolysin family protein [Alphaproteobacteria bacterium]
MDFLLIIFLTLLNGLFALSEMALSASRRVRLLTMSEMGDERAAAALRLMDQPTRFLSSIQIGITSIGVLNGIVGEAAFSQGLSRALVEWGVAANWADVLATALVVGLITCITIVFGELVPKRIAQIYPETVARWVSPAMEKLAWLTRPLVALLSLLTSMTLHLMRVDTRAESSVTEEEIRASLSEGVDAGVIEQQEHQMVRNVFHLDDRPLSSLMVPRTGIVWLDHEESVSQALLQLRHRPSHSWYPVCRGGLDDVLGLVSLADLLQQDDDTLALGQLAQPVAFIPETLSGLDLLEQFRRPNAQRQAPAMARVVLVVDEYGVVQGLMTPRDLLEAITGEWVGQAADDNAWATRETDGNWLLDGAMPIIEFKHQLGIEQDLPDESKDRYNTVAGLFLSLLGRLPEVGERVECADWQLEVLALEGRRIDRLRATSTHRADPNQGQMSTT